MFSYIAIAYFEDFKGIDILRNIETVKLKCYREIITLLKETLGFIHMVSPISTVQENIKSLFKKHLHFVTQK